MHIRFQLCHLRTVASGHFPASLDLHFFCKVVIIGLSSGLVERMFLTYLSLASSQPHDRSSILIVGRIVQVSFSLKQKPSSGHFLVRLIILLMEGFSSVNPGSLSLPLVPGLVSLSRGYAALQHWVGGAGLCTSPAPCFTLVTGGAGGLQLHSPAWLFPLIRTMRKSSLSLHLALCPCFFSFSLLMMSSLPPGVWRSYGCLPSCLRCCRRLWALTRASLPPMHHPASSTLLSLGHCVAGSICEPPLPGAPERKWHSASVWPYISPSSGTRVFPPSSPDVAQHGHTITSYALLSSQA